MVVSAAPDPVVVWHDLECGGYRADLALWRELADAAAEGSHSARVLDLGAGSGRVTLELARAGHRLTALDRDERLLAALRERAGGLAVETIAADARDFELRRGGFDLCLVPMQTLQLLRGPAERRALFTHAREHLREGGLLACAIVSDVDEFDSLDGGLGPSPERTKIGPTLYLSRAVRVRRSRGTITIERERLIVADGDETPAVPEHDVVELEVLPLDRLGVELTDAGLEPQPIRTIAETEDHSGSEVVIGRA